MRARRLIVNWIAARVTNAARVSARFFIVLGLVAVAAEPGKGSLDYPSTEQHDEAFDVVRALDDLEPPARGPPPFPPLSATGCR